MPSYRYRTAALLGAWRSSPASAMKDAVRAKQASPVGIGAAWHWRVAGSIETGSGKVGPEPESYNNGGLALPA